MNSTTKTILVEIHAIAASIFIAKDFGHHHLHGATITVAEQDAVTVETISHPSFNVTHVHIGPPQRHPHVYRRQLGVRCVDSVDGR